LGSSTELSNDRERAEGRIWLDVALLTLVLFVTAGWPPPDVNEAHYLTKARRFWDPSWCPGDLFLDSADAHGVFYWTIGWLTRFVSLPAAAWIGRFVSWTFLAWSWTRLSRVFAPSWLWAVLSGALMAAMVSRCHMSGEWIVGGLEAKTFAYGFVFLGLREAVLGRWPRAGALLGAAAAFHVLVGGWAWIAVALAWLIVGRSQSSFRELLPLWLLGLGLSLFSVVPAVWLGRGASANEQALANQIYVYMRLSHHLAFHRFPPIFIIRHGVLVAVWGAAAFMFRGDSKLRCVNTFVAGAVLLSLAGITIDLSLMYRPNQASSLLRFYWFRLADVAVPGGVAIMAIAALRSSYQRKWSLGPYALGLSTLLVAAHVVSVQYDRRAEMLPASVSAPLPPMTPAQREQWALDWRDACQWAKENTPKDARFLTPRRQQTFKWYSHRGEVANWKDVPQNARAIIDWRDRMQEIYTPETRRFGLGGRAVKELKMLGEKYGADYVLLDQSLAPGRLRLRRVYPEPFSESRFAIYRLR